MNTYTKTFIATCPVDGENIIYALAIQSKKMIHVEHINTACALQKSGFHEDIADALHAVLGGEQTIEATHAGVRITTVRGSASRKPRTSCGCAGKGFEFCNCT